MKPAAHAAGAVGLADGDGDALVAQLAEGLVVHLVGVRLAGLVRDLEHHERHGARGLISIGSAVLAANGGGDQSCGRRQHQFQVAGRQLACGGVQVLVVSGDTEIAGGQCPRCARHRDDQADPRILRYVHPEDRKRGVARALRPGGLIGCKASSPPTR